jgi:Fe-S cluster assembly iron-binding protein IscA
MITVTERAASALEALLTDSVAEPGQGVKLIPNGKDSIGMVIDAPNEGDEVVRRGDAPLLIVDRAISEPLDGSQIDCEDDVDGRTQTHFTLQRPSG